jgi:alkylation response protein AidB-like acyl-CoA dehydrogenase
MLSGDLCVGVATAEPRVPHLLSHVRMRTQTAPRGWRLNGVKSMVLGGSAGDAVIVPARTSGDVADRAGISLFLVDGSAAGLVRRPYQLADGSLVAEMAFDDVEVPLDRLLGTEGAGYEAWENALSRASVVLAAEAIGIMDAAIQQTLDYLRTRRQFGVVIGSFQTIQHRMADCVAELELARSLTLKAAIVAGSADTPRAEQLRAAFGAKAYVARTGMRIAEECVQFHGAIGITEELNIGRFMKRLLLIAELFGGERVQTRRRDMASASEVR